MRTLLTSAGMWYHSAGSGYELIMAVAILSSTHLTPMLPYKDHTHNTIASISVYVCVSIFTRSATHSSPRPRSELAVDNHEAALRHSVPPSSIPHGHSRRIPAYRSPPQVTDNTLLCGTSKPWLLHCFPTSATAEDGT